MALFKIFRGPEEGLNEIPCHDGYAYFTQDSGKLFIDIGNEPGDRVQVNAFAAEALIKENADGTFEYIDIDDLMLKDAIASVAQGGTGRNSLTVNALLVGNGTNAIKMVSMAEGGLAVGDATNGIKSLTGTGVLFALSSGAPEFGLVPISLGGTNANTATGARTNLDVFSKGEVNSKVEKVTSKVYTATLYASGWVSSDSQYTYSLSLTSIKCGAGGDVHPIITYTSNKDEYSNIDSAEATIGVGIVFTATKKPENDIGISIIDVG